MIDENLNFDTEKTESSLEMLRQRAHSQSVNDYLYELMNSISKKYSNIET